MIFFDTNVIVDFFIAKYNNGKENKRHRRAVELWKTNFEEKIISNLIIVEVINVLYLKHKKDKELIKKVYRSLLTDFDIINDSGYYDDGYKKLMENQQKLSINDCIYLSIMEDYNIKKIVSFDSHFDNKKGITRIY